MDNKTATGKNRSGMQMSPLDAASMHELADMTVPPRGSAMDLARIRAGYNGTRDGLGSVPPPGTLKGVASNVSTAVAGRRSPLLIDKLSERLAFERGGVRLYDAFIQKLELLRENSPEQDHDGWPDTETVMQFRNEELQHARLVKSCIEQIGGDPTVQTPCANLTALESSGLVQAMAEPRANLMEALHVLLLAEVADGEGWAALIELAEYVGQPEMAEEFRSAASQEALHATTVRTWHLDAVRRNATLMSDS